MSHTLGRSTLSRLPYVTSEDWSRVTLDTVHQGLLCPKRRAWEMKTSTFHFPETYFTQTSQPTHTYPTHSSTAFCSSSGMSGGGGRVQTGAWLTAVLDYKRNHLLLLQFFRCGREQTCMIACKQPPHSSETAAPVAVILVWQLTACDSYCCEWQRRADTRTR